MGTFALGSRRGSQNLCTDSSSEKLNPNKLYPNYIQQLPHELAIRDHPPSVSVCLGVEGVAPLHSPAGYLAIIALVKQKSQKKLLPQKFQSFSLIY